MKTPMQSLIEQLEKDHKMYEGLREESVAYGLERAITFAKQMLEKEKEVIEEAYDDGYLDSVFKSSEQYFDKTFNTKEK